MKIIIGKDVIDIKDYIEMRKNQMKELRYSQCARLYDAQTEWYTSWFRFYRKGDKNGRNH